MPATLEQLQSRFASLSQREKIITLGTALLSLWAGWDTLIHQPMQQRQRLQATEIATLANTLQTQRSLIEQMSHPGQQNPNQEKLTQMRQSVDSLKRQLGFGEKKFVPPPLMASALRDMLKQHGNLKLVELKTLPPMPFGSGDQQPAWVYRHALTLTVQGDFFSTLNYLQALESLPWRIHWDSIDYRVKGYPLAETRIQVYTLSFEQDWLGG